MGDLHGDYTHRLRRQGRRAKQPRGVRRAVTDHCDAPVVVAWSDQSQIAVDASGNVYSPNLKTGDIDIYAPQCGKLRARTEWYILWRRRQLRLDLHAKRLRERAHRSIDQATRNGRR